MRARASKPSAAPPHTTADTTIKRTSTSGRSIHSTSKTPWTMLFTSAMLPPPFGAKELRRGAGRCKCGSELSPVHAKEGRGCPMPRAPATLPPELATGAASSIAIPSSGLSGRLPLRCPPPAVQHPGPGGAESSVPKPEPRLLRPRRRASMTRCAHFRLRPRAPDPESRPQSWPSAPLLPRSLRLEPTLRISCPKLPSCLPSTHRPHRLHRADRASATTRPNHSATRRRPSPTRNSLAAIAAGWGEAVVRRTGRPPHFNPGSFNRRASVGEGAASELVGNKGSSEKLEATGPRLASGAPIFLAGWEASATLTLA